MAVQTSIIVLAGYAYSRYNFLARKQSLVFFLIIQMVPTMAAWLPSLLWPLCWMPPLTIAGLHLPICWWWYPNERLVDERPLWHSTNVSRRICKLDGAGHFRRFKLFSHSPAQWLQYALGLHGTFRDYILVSFREKEYFTVAVGLQTFVSNVKNLDWFHFQQVLSSSPFQSVFFFLQRTLFQDS